MKVEIEGNVCTVTREKGDPKFRDSQWGSAESRLLYHVQKKLNSQGFDLIKKRMSKDGHLVSDDQLYLRARKKPTDPEKNIAVYNSMWQIRGAEEPFNEDGKVELAVVRDCWKGDKKNG